MFYDGASCYYIVVIAMFTVILHVLYHKLSIVAIHFRFQTLEQNCRKDLGAVKNACRHGDPPPKYHYEMRQYSIVKYER